MNLRCWRGKHDWAIDEGERVRKDGTPALLHDYRCSKCLKQGTLFTKRGRGFALLIGWSWDKVNRNSEPQYREGG